MYCFVVYETLSRIGRHFLRSLIYWILFHGTITLLRLFSVLLCFESIIYALQLKMMETLALLATNLYAIIINAVNQRKTFLCQLHINEIFSDPFAVPSFMFAFIKMLLLTSTYLFRSRILLWLWVRTAIWRCLTWTRGASWPTSGCPNPWPGPTPAS